MVKLCCLYQLIYILYSYRIWIELVLYFNPFYMYYILLLGYQELCDTHVIMTYSICS